MEPQIPTLLRWCAFSLYFSPKTTNINGKSELEHRTSKARYRRTSRKDFVKQMTQIERRQTRIRRIREKLAHTEYARDEDASTSPGAHHHIGKSQNNPEHFGRFLERNSGDPAIKVAKQLKPEAGSHSSFVTGIHA